MMDSNSYIYETSSELPDSSTRYELIKQIGNGQFSTVYQARLTIPKQRKNSQSRLLNNDQAKLDLFHTSSESSFRSLDNNPTYTNQMLMNSISQNSTLTSQEQAETQTETIDVALKHIKLCDIQDSKLRFDCLQEVKLLQQLRHPNIINCMKSFIICNNLYIVLELADGGDLCKLINYFSRRKRLIVERTILKYFTQICSAIKYIHSQRIMHRDIKPANIFMTSAGVVKLGDFGLGREFSDLTLDAHSLVGTFYYMSPERINKTGYDFSSDVWSLGCVLYELITLHSPFSKVNFEVNQQVSKATSSHRDIPQIEQRSPIRQPMNLIWLIDRICNSNYPSLSRFENVSHSIKELTNKCLISKPADRPNMDYICQVVESVYEKYSGQSSQQANTNQTRQQ